MADIKAYVRDSVRGDAEMTLLVRDEIRETEMQIAQDTTSFIPIYKNEYDRDGYRTRSLTFVYEKKK